MSPRPIKSLCDAKRSVKQEEAQLLLENAVAAGLISERGDEGLSKYIWSVDQDGEVYEAKTDQTTSGSKF